MSPILPLIFLAVGVLLLIFGPGPFKLLGIIALAVFCWQGYLFVDGLFHHAIPALMPTRVPFSQLLRAARTGRLSCTDLASYSNLYRTCMAHVHSHH